MQQMIDGLLGNHRIGLKLSKTLDMDVVEKENARYCHKFVDLSGTALGSLAEPKRVSNPSFDRERFRQNYAIIHCGGLGFVRLFIHGRDLLCEAWAKRIFTDGESPQVIPYEAFEEKSKNRIRKLLRPESMLEREAFGKMHYSDDQERLKDIAWHKKHEKDISDFEKTLLPGFSKIYAHYAGHLDHYLSKHNHDRQIIKNFREGVQKIASVLIDTSLNYLPELKCVLDAGIEAQTEKMLRSAAKQMANPYDECFIKAEYEVARTIAEAVHPRVLRNLLHHSTAILATDNHYIDIFDDVVSDLPGVALGKYDPCHSHFATIAQNDFILLASPSLDSGRMARLARHEVEHHFDFTNKQLFSSLYGPRGKEWLAQEKIQLDAIIARMEIISSESPYNEIEFLRKLGHIRGIDAKEILSSENINMLKRILVNDIKYVRQRASRFFYSHQDEMAGKLLSERLDELPAVIEELKGTFGNPFVRVLLPQSSRYAREHQLRHLGLTDSSDRYR